MAGRRTGHAPRQLASRSTSQPSAGTSGPARLQVFWGLPCHNIMSCDGLMHCPNAESVQKLTRNRSVGKSGTAVRFQKALWYPCHDLCLHLGQRCFRTFAAVKLAWSGAMQVTVGQSNCLLMQTGTWAQQQGKKSEGLVLCSVLQGRTACQQNVSRYSRGPSMTNSNAVFMLLEPKLCC